MRTPPIRRVVLALEPGAPVEEGVREAAALAGQLEAPLVVLYGAEQDLLRLRDLPPRLTRLVSVGRGGELEAGRVSWELRVSVEAARRAVVEIAGSAGVTVLFHEMEGALSEGIPTLVLESDLVVFQRHARGPGGTSRLREAGLAALWRISAPVLLIDGGQGQRAERRGPLDLALERAAPTLRRAALRALLAEGAWPQLASAGLIVVRRAELGGEELSRALATRGSAVLIV